jgi:hypothetical protein
MRIFTATVLSGLMSGFMVIGLAIANQNQPGAMTAQEDAMMTATYRQRDTSYRGSGRRAVMAFAAPTTSSATPF